ncbi:MAG: DUF4167 domain-containing protein, partial [Pseudomonadota bacterium]|nr:DUF4167 domain-containing protein [Pseudomonadota bacterium]
MRPSQKSNRNRGKNNRPKSMGNVVNRVFESAGPEGKVRGTPQQIIEKYEQLARDSQTAGDRVTAENFLQHAEHYLRLLSAAQAEQQANSQPQQPRDRNDAQQKNDGDDDQPYIGGQGGRNSGQSGSANGAANGTANGHGGGAGSGSALETIDSSDDSDPLVATPEAESRGDAKPDAAGD